MQCPHCNVTLMMSDRQGIEIDYCPQCRGVWLDRGELDKIIERTSVEVAPAQPARPAAEPYREAPYRDHRYSDDGRRHGVCHGKYRKKKSLLSELFDF